MMPTHIATPVPATPSRSLLWTVDQFHYLGDLGMFEGRWAMLIDGVIVEEGAMSPPHRIALELSSDVLRTVFGAGWRVCVQMPLILGQTTGPEPEVNDRADDDPDRERAFVNLENVIAYLEGKARDV